MLQSIKDGYEFERIVCEIIYKTNPYNLSYYDGGPDRGRDICVEYKNKDIKYSVIIECKFYHSGVNKEIIMPALDWATVHQPDLLYFWVVPYLTPSAKDFIHAFEKKYNISVRIEEKMNIEEYLKYINDDFAKIWISLRQKILDSCIEKYGRDKFIPEYDLDESKNTPFLIDREPERNKLLHNNQQAFFLQGVSACGKTQLLKYIAFIYIQKGLPILWYTIRPSNVEQQCSDFFHTLARYFNSVHKDKALLEYFNSYGFFLSQDLENLVAHMLKKYNPILFLDDVHNCQNENISMRTLFKKLVIKQTCRIYFSGWFNIFNLSLKERNYIETIILEGMRKKELDLIIKHCSGENNPSIAELIEQQFYGLPGYAVITDQGMTVDEIKEADDFLARFLLLLSSEEQVVLYTLSLLSMDIPEDFLRKQGYAIQLTSLKNKNLLVTRKNCYTVHDKYRKYFSQCTIEESVLSKIILLINKYAISQPSAYLDLINYRIYENNYTEALDIISNNFQLLISQQFYSQLLMMLQEIEKNAQGKIDINNIISKKIVLLERLTNYKTCLHYISLLNDISIFNPIERETIFYVQLRCLYFTNKYDDILKLYEDNFFTIENYTDKEIYINILLIVGRVYYIRGSSKGALIYYLLAYQHAHKLQKKPLELKAIHRIAMIECRLGLVVDSRKTFQELLKLGALLTPKRRSYIYFRIAKCFYKEDNLEKAKEYNDKSMKIKESYNDTRGLLFSASLSAKICYKEGDYVGSYFHSSIACEYADNLNLHKEWLTAAIIKFRTVLYKMTSEKNAPDICSDLQRGLNIAIEEKLFLRLLSIEKLTKLKYPDLSLIALKSREKVEEELENEEKRLLEHYIKKQNLNLLKEYELLIMRNVSITQSLLLRSGFFDPIEFV